MIFKSEHFQPVNKRPLPLQDVAPRRLTDCSPQWSSDSGYRVSTDNETLAEVREVTHWRCLGTQRSGKRPQQPCQTENNIKKTRGKNANAPSWARWNPSVGVNYKMYDVTIGRSARQKHSTAILSCKIWVYLNSYHVRGDKISEELKLHTAHPPCQGGRHVFSDCIALCMVSW